MDASTATAGSTYEPTTYAVGREKIREYALAVGESDPVHLDLVAARAAGLPDLLAPPMFVVVYTAPAILQVLSDDAVGMDLARVVHGGQEFVWGRDVVAGDEITTTWLVADVFARGGNDFHVVRTESRNQDGDDVCVGTWTFIVRGDRA